MFEVFDFFWKVGDCIIVLVEFFIVVILELIVEKYFGIENLIGKVLCWNEENELRVIGVFEDFKLNNYMIVDFFVFMLIGK